MNEADLCNALASGDRSAFVYLAESAAEGTVVRDIEFPISRAQNLSLRGIVFSNVQFDGDVRVQLNATACRFENCRFGPADALATSEITTRIEGVSNRFEGCRGLLQISGYPRDPSEYHEVDQCEMLRLWVFGHATISNSTIVELNTSPAEIPFERGLLSNCSIDTLAQNRVYNNRFDNCTIAQLGKSAFEFASRELNDVELNNTRPAHPISNFKFKNVRWNQSDLSNLIFLGCTFEKLTFTECNLEGTRFIACRNEGPAVVDLPAVPEFAQNRIKPLTELEKLIKGYSSFESTALIHIRGIAVNVCMVRRKTGRGFESLVEYAIESDSRIFRAPYDPGKLKLKELVLKCRSFIAGKVVAESITLVVDDLPVNAEQAEFCRALWLEVFDIESLS